jgi:ribonuclease P protein component
MGNGNENPAPSLETLKKRSQFLAVAATGKRWVSSSFILQIGKVSHEGQNEKLFCGFTTSSKIGNAVVRNRARRRLRVLAREVLRVHADFSREYVLIGRAATGSCPLDQMENDLQKGLKRLGLWRA